MRHIILFKNLFVAIFALFLGDLQPVAATPSSSGNFMLPIIPTAIVDVDSRREYLAMHYWDNFNFSTSEPLKDDSLMAVVIGGYVQVLMMNPPKIVEKSIEATLNRALKSGYDNFSQLTSKLEDCLYSPNSPMRDEEIYIYVLRYIVDKAPIEEVYKLRSRRQLDMVQKNRLGGVATDFEYENRAGQLSTLHAINTPFIILFFNTPSCEDCVRVKQEIGKSAHLTKMVDDKLLTILGIYTERDREPWHAASFPSIILNGADPQCKITRDNLYDLKALPTLYLLDGDKRIILKDRSIEEVKAYLK